MVARAWGALQGEAEQRGSRLPVVDSLIAATARVHNLTMVTRTVRDLQRCGVPVVNPWQPPTS
jgi:predicted nucleic acid-binding protein